MTIRSSSCSPEEEDSLTRSQENRFFAEYMRFSMSPDTKEPVIEKAPFPEEENETFDYPDDAEDAYEDGILHEPVPLSSSPPDFTSSSPQSCSLGSQDSESDTCSTLTSLSSDLNLGGRQLNVSDFQLSENLGMKDFTQKLHGLLLAVLQERRRLKDETKSLVESDCYSSVVTGSSDAEDDDERASVVSSSDAERNAEDNNDQDVPVKPNYRIIKRARSSTSTEQADDSAEGPSKRQKTRGADVSYAKPRIYAHRTASLRRAESLKIVCVNAPLKKESNYVETEPATPVPEHRSRSSDEEPSVRSPAVLTPVPIIAPPIGHIAKFPLSTEQCAKQRLFALLEREQDGRNQDEHNRVDLASEWEAALGLGREDREEAVEWLLKVMPKPNPRSCSHSTTATNPASSAATSDSEESLNSDTPQRTPSQKSTSAVTTTVHRDATPSSSFSNLEDQLVHSPDTRFHAVWMLLRYFHLCMRRDGNGRKHNTSGKSGLSRTASAESSAPDSEGLNLVLWDAVVGCLSISVKLHRDFLDPLLPVFAHEYLELAPHEMGYEDLETAHRDILSAFDYRLGVTPQPIMDELWLALPSLRALLKFNRGWEHAISHSWTILFIALDEPDILRFPVSMLTIVALMDGVVQSLAAYTHMKQVKKMGERMNCDGQDAGTLSSTLALWRRYRKKAREESEGVLCDIQALTGITDAELRECRAWIRNLD